MNPERTPPAKILVIEDEKKTSAVLRLYLEAAGYSVLAADDGARGLALAASEKPHLVVLDLMLPKLDGWEICRNLRELGDVPILILSARQEEEDRLRGLELGADDYVVKPFSPREVVARVKAILRRASTQDPGTSPASSTAIAIDSEGQFATAYGKEVRLTPSEFRLLSALLRRPGRTFTREELLEALYPHGGTVVLKAIDVHMAHLRRKLEPEPKRPRHLLTVRGFGYRFLACVRADG